MTTIDFPLYVWLTLGGLSTFAFSPDRRTVRLLLWGVALIAQFLALPYSLSGTMAVDPHALIFGGAVTADLIDGVFRLFRMDND